MPTCWIKSSRVGRKLTHCTLGEAILCEFPCGVAGQWATKAIYRHLKLLKTKSSSNSLNIESRNLDIIYTFKNGRFIQAVFEALNRVVPSSGLLAVCFALDKYPAPPRESLNWYKVLL